MEEALIGADLGADLTIEVVTKARARRDLPPELALQAELIALFAPRDPTPWPRKPAADVPAVILVVGVNGTGKTTSIAKLAYRFHTRGAKVLLAAGDTFRAAAIEQLQTWAKRIDVPVVAHAANADPSAVVWDAMDAAAARGTDVVIVDTAGRLHTKHNLMEELAKIRRTIARRLPTATPEVLFVLDATTGQNGLTQAKAFHEAAGLTGIALDQARFDLQGRHRLRHRARAGRAGPVRGCRREGRRPARLRPQRIRPGPLRLTGAGRAARRWTRRPCRAARQLAGRDPDLATTAGDAGPAAAVAQGRRVSRRSSTSCWASRCRSARHAQRWSGSERPPGAVTPAAVAALGEDGLRAAGQTRQKARYLAGLAEASHERPPGPGGARPASG